MCQFLRHKFSSNRKSRSQATMLLDVQKYESLGGHLSAPGIVFLKIAPGGVSLRWQPVQLHVGRG